MTTRLLLSLVLLLGGWLAFLGGDGAAQPQPAAVILDIKGGIGPATTDYVRRGLENAAKDGAPLVILRIDTPGGLDSAMRDIVKDILASPIPVATFISPSGARAASAGTYILYASHIAAMAPGTNLGAATPIRVGFDGTENDSPAQPSTLAQKQVHDASAYIRSLAQMRGRNADWAEKAVTEAASLSADEALKLHVVDYIATDVAALLDRLQGTHVAAAGTTVTLDVSGAPLVAFDPDWRARVLSVIASPDLALVLMMLGIYGLLFEFFSPGYVLPGVVGGICLLLALFAFQMLPYSYTGLGLIALGLIFLVAEVFVPTSGVLAIGGVVAFVVGAMFLIDTDVPGYGISWPLILTLAGVSALFVLLVLGMAVKARRRPVVSGREELVGARGEALSDFTGEGWATVHGETWRVRSAVPVAQGQPLRVTRVDGLTLDVESQSIQPEGSTS